MALPYGFTVDAGTGEKQIDVTNNITWTHSCEPFTDDEIEPMQRVKPNRAERRRKQKIRQRTEWD